MTDKTRDERIAHAFRNVDTKDVEWLLGRMGYGGHDLFWKSVLHEVNRALYGVGEQQDKPHVEPQKS